MKATPLVSVVIPIYNLEAYLGEAVDSVLNQTCQDFEILLIDDGSTDRSREIIARYQQERPERVRVIFLEHGGAAAARNTGIAAARGQWIAFLDGDDIWKPAKLERQLLAAAANPACDFIACAAEVLGQNRPLPPPPTPPFDLKLELLRRGCFITLSTVMLKRYLLSSIRFDARLEGAQDLDLFLRLADSIHVCFLPDPLVLYRIRAEAISGLRGDRFLQLHRQFQVLQQELRQLQQDDSRRIRADLAELQRVLNRLAHEAAYSAIMNPRAAVGLRLKLSATAIARCPRQLKNYRILLQSLLPAALNQRLAQFRHRDIPVHGDGDTRQPHQHS